MIVLGIDPGAWLGWCALRVSARVGFLAAGVISVDEMGEDAAIVGALAFGASCEEGIALAALERVERVLPTLAFQRGAAQQAQRLVDAAWLGGRLLQGLLADGPQIRIATPTADCVRRHFVAPVGPAKRGEKKPDMDSVLAAVAAQRIGGWPAKIPGRGAAYRKDGSDLMADRRSHAVDAALCALWAAEH
jgi:hypothetical protein